MLILSQKPGERIEIDGPCVITLTEIRNGRIRLGFEADRTTNIRRIGVADTTPNQEEKAA
jgi:carbon storage regulator CsrA